jgi:DNA-binding beta-propeller fold protein YncE
VDGNTNQVLQTVPVPSAFPSALAVNPATGLTYVTDDNANQVVVLQPN